MNSGQVSFVKFRSISSADGVFKDLIVGEDGKNLNEKEIRGRLWLGFLHLERPD